MMSTSNSWKIIGKMAPLSPISVIKLIPRIVNPWEYMYNCLDEQSASEGSTHANVDKNGSEIIDDIRIISGRASI